MNWRDIFTIEAEADPIVTIRVSALVAVDNTIPESLSAQDLSNGRMRLVVTLRGLEQRRAAYLVRKIESIPSVVSISASRIWP